MIPFHRTRPSRSLFALKTLKSDLNNTRDALNLSCSTYYGVANTEHYFPLCHAYDVITGGLLICIKVILFQHGLNYLSNEEFIKSLCVVIKSCLAASNG